MDPLGRGTRSGRGSTWTEARTTWSSTWSSRTSRPIERNGDEGARVTLRDGRSYELSGSNDVDAGNRGIFVFLEAAPAAGDRNGGGTDAPGDRGEWRHVAWEDFREAHFRRPPAGSGS